MQVTAREYRFAFVTMSGEMDQKELRKDVHEKEGEIVVEGKASNIVASLRGEAVNASGHKDELARQYGLLSIIGIALNVDNAWVVSRCRGMPAMHRRG